MDYSNKPRRKYGYRLASGGFIARYTVYDAFSIKGRPKEIQLGYIAGFFKLNIDWVKSQSYKIVKSGNLRYHPATYSLEIVGHGCNIRRAGE